MEPLYELVDRITATVWLFVKCLPVSSAYQQEHEPDRLPGVASPSLREASDRLLMTAHHDYAKLQELIDLYKPYDPRGDYLRDPYAWVNEGPRTFRSQTMLIFQKIKGSAVHLGTQMASRLGILSKNDTALDAPLSTLWKGSNRNYRETAAVTVVNALTARIVILEEMWSQDGPVSSDTAIALLDYCNVSTSDEMFESLLNWIGSPAFTIEKRSHLATAFLPVEIGVERLSQTRFLLEAAINRRAREVRSDKTVTVLKPLSVDLQGSASTRQTIARLSEILLIRPTDHEAELTATRAQLSLSWRNLKERGRLEILLDRDLLRCMCRSIDVSVPFSLAFSDELEEILHSRPLRMSSDPLAVSRVTRWTDYAPQEEDQAHITSKDRSGSLPDQEAFDAKLFGVAFSGGGIRSATFALGISQAMADHNVLPYIDITSSVSGGGYFNSFLIAWIKRRGGVHSVQASLRGNATTEVLGLEPPMVTGASADSPLRNQNPRADHLRPVRLLREYARYLAPQDGMFSADTWTIGATWLRNTFLNLVILSLLLVGIILVPRIAVLSIDFIRGIVVPSFQETVGQTSTLSSLFGVQLLLLFLICAFIGIFNLRSFNPDYQIGPGVTRGWGDTTILCLLILPLFIAASLFVDTIWAGIDSWHLNRLALYFGIVCLLGQAIMAVSSFYIRKDGTLLSNTLKSANNLIRLSGLGIITSAIAGLLVVIVVKVTVWLSNDTARDTWIIAAFGAPAFLVVVTTVVFCMIGLAGDLISDAQREWWSRLGAWLAIVICAWILLSTISFFAPLIVGLVGIRLASLVGGTTWGVVTAAGVKAAFSPRASGASHKSTQGGWRRVIVTVAPVVFVVGLLAIASCVAFEASLVAGHGLPGFAAAVGPGYESSCCTVSLSSLPGVVDNYWQLLNPQSALPVIVAAGCLMLAYAFAGRVNVNAFSMHHFYRNRLVRAYLGASRQRAHRKPNAFTAFDPQDDVYLHRFCHNDKSIPDDRITDCQRGYRGPYPIINTALNVTRGQDLGIQQRRAESFFFSPLWSGFDYSRKQTLVRASTDLEFGFRQTRTFGSFMSGGKGGAFLGTAMAISGAAFSSNAGFHTSPPLAFLLTVFGVRLGWWAGNPRKRRWGEDFPRRSLRYLACELTANTTVDRDFVLLTDGGHFENMGLYELVRRKCKFIIVCDAEQDDNFQLEGIGGAVRKCRSDFGVVIDLDLSLLRPLEGDAKESLMHFSVGTIRYPGVDESGVVIYIKSSLTGDESVDLVEFGKSHPEFPHTPTIDQMFDEAHFESYRELGHHIGSYIFKAMWKPTDEITNNKEFKQEVSHQFTTIYQQWSVDKGKTGSSG